MNAEAHADRRRKFTLGNARFSVSPGSSWKVRVKLSRSGMRVLRKLKSINAVVTVSAVNERTADEKFGIKLKASARR